MAPVGRAMKCLLALIIYVAARRLRVNRRWNPIDRSIEERRWNALAEAWFLTTGETLQRFDVFTLEVR